MEEATQPDKRRSERRWKLFLLLPRMLLHRPGRGGNISKTKLTSRFDDFSAGRWDVLISASEACDIGAIVDRARRRRHRRLGDDVKRGAARALTLVQLGELSSGRQALEGADVAPGTERTLNMLRSEETTHTRPGDVAERHHRIRS